MNKEINDIIEKCNITDEEYQEAVKDAKTCGITLLEALAMNKYFKESGEYFSDMI